MERWQEKAAVFDQRAAEYDQWYEGSLLFDIELQALKGVQSVLRGPALEIGVGSGRFAEALGLMHGLDPAHSALRLARSRGMSVCQGIGEQLPYRNGVFGTVYLLFALCFVEAPDRVLAECVRVLTPGGGLLVGMVPAASPWGHFLAAKKAAGHPFYRHARFYGVAEAERLLREAGLTVIEQRSTLYQPPGKVEALEGARVGVSAEAGFVILVSRKAEQRPSYSSQ